MGRSAREPGVRLTFFLLSIHQNRLLLNFVLQSSLDISQARCITLACYLTQELNHYVAQDGLLREQWFENIKPVPWANLPRNLWALINNDVSAMFPPYSVQSFLPAHTCSSCSSHADQLGLSSPPMTFLTCLLFCEWDIIK